MYIFFFQRETTLRFVSGCYTFITLQSRRGPVQGQNRVFPVYFSHTGKNLFSLQGSQVMKTSFSLWEKVHRENPVFITGMGLQCRYLELSLLRVWLFVCLLLELFGTLLTAITDKEFCLNKIKYSFLKIWKI